MSDQLIGLIPTLLFANVALFFLALALVFLYSKYLLQDRMGIRESESRRFLPPSGSVKVEALATSSSKDLKELSNRLRSLESRLDATVGRLDEFGDGMKRIPTMITHQIDRLINQEASAHANIPPETDARTLSRRRPLLRDQLTPEGRRVAELSSLVAEIVDALDSRMRSDLQDRYANFVEMDRRIRRWDQAPSEQPSSSLSELLENLDDLRGKSYVNPFMRLLDACRDIDAAAPQRKKLLDHFGLEEVTYQKDERLSDLSEVNVTRGGLSGEGETFFIESVVRPGYRDLKSGGIVRKPEVRVMLKTEYP